uniref:tRNA pseudouridine synthase n=1 Tax=Macrostomum lignano TaxID=282301 RepID=A0A1I8HQ33_9PLAT
FQAALPIGLGLFWSSCCSWRTRGLVPQTFKLASRSSSNAQLTSDKTAGRSQLLLYVSYNGCPYNGAANHSSDWQVRSVSKALHHHLIQLMGPSRWINRLSISSRTDKDVHALMNTVSVRHSGPIDYSVALLRLMLNASLKQSGQSIRIHLIRPVPLSSGEFSLVTGVARREYVYRLAQLAEPGLTLMHPEAAWLGSSRWLVEPPLSLELLHQAAGVLNGEHDFSAFTNLNGLSRCYTPLRRLEICVDDSVSVDRLHACNSFTSDCFTGCVRFMAGALVATAKGTVTLDQLKDMLSNPPDYTGLKPYDAAPPHGLYLKCVCYANPKWDLNWPDIQADNATLNTDFCRQLLIRFRDKTCPMNIVELSREHEAYLATVAKETSSVETARDKSCSRV